MNDIDKIIREWKRIGYSEQEVMESILNDPVYKLWYKQKYPKEPLEYWPLMLQNFKLMMNPRSRLPWNEWIQYSPTAYKEGKEVTIASLGYQS